MNNDVYVEIPILDNEHFILRAINAEKDMEDLLKVYSDEKSVPFFNVDGCYGGNFYLTTKEQMKVTINAWDFCYHQKDFVRWAIEDKHRKAVVGTIELFNRKAEDFFDNCGLLRLDLKSDYEVEDYIESILNIIIPEVKNMFGCDKVATKAVPNAVNRISVLEKLGLKLSKEYLIDKEGNKYNYYYVMKL